MATGCADSLEHSPPRFAITRKCIRILPRARWRGCRDYSAAASGRLGSDENLVLILRLRAQRRRNRNQSRLCLRVNSSPPVTRLSSSPRHAERDSANGPSRSCASRRLSQLREQLHWCDVVFQNNITLRHLVPALVARKPVLLVHQTWMRNTAGEIGWNDRIKRALVSRVKNMAISEAIARDIGAPR